MAHGVREAPVVEYLQEHVEDVRMGLLDLVEEDDGVGPPPHLLGQEAALFVPDVAWRGAEEARHRELFHVLGHVHPDERVLVPEEVLREGAGELGLSHSGRSEEDEGAHGTAAVLEPGPRAPDGSRHGHHRVLLTHDAPVQGLFHPGELRRFLLLELGERDPRPAGHDVLDVFLADRLRALALALVPLPLHLLVATAQKLFLLPERGGLLELLCLEVHVLLTDDTLDFLADLLDLGRRRQGHEPRSRGRLVDHVDGLVGQLAVRDVAVRELHRRVDGLVGDLDPMMRLVLVAKPLDDLDRFGHGGRPHDDGLEAPLEGPVLLDVLSILVERGGADGLDLAAGEGRLQHVRGVDRAFGGPRPDQGVELVEEEHDVFRLADLLHDRLEPLLELAAVLRPRHECPQVELEQALLGEHVRHLVSHDALGEAFHDGGLAYAGLADEDGVVLGPAGQDLDHPLDLRLAPDDRVELALAGELGQVAGELVEHGGLRALLGPRVVLVAQEGQGFLPDLVQPRPEGLEDLGGDGLALFHEAQEEVLGPDVVVAELACFLDRELEDALGLGGERDFTEGQGLGEAGEGPLDLGLDRL